MPNIEFSAKNKSVWVAEHTKADGTVVAGHWKANTVAHAIDVTDDLLAEIDNESPPPPEKNEEEWLIVSEHTKVEMLPKAPPWGGQQPKSFESGPIWKANTVAHAIGEMAALEDQKLTAKALGVPDEMVATVLKLAAANNADLVATLSKWNEGWSQGGFHTSLTDMESWKNLSGHTGHQELVQLNAAIDTVSEHIKQANAKQANAKQANAMFDNLKDQYSALIGHYKDALAEIEKLKQAPSQPVEWKPTLWAAQVKSVQMLSDSSTTLVFKTPVPYKPGDLFIANGKPLGQVTVCNGAVTPDTGYGLDYEVTVKVKSGNDELVSALVHDQFPAATDNYVPSKIMVTGTTWKPLPEFSDTEKVSQPEVATKSDLDWAKVEHEVENPCPMKVTGHRWVASMIQGRLSFTLAPGEVCVHKARIDGEWHEVNGCEAQIDTIGYDDFDIITPVPCKLHHVEATDDVEEHWVVAVFPK